MSSSTADLANTDEAVGNNLHPTPRLFNDLYFDRESESISIPSPSTWTPFSRLPTELRVQIWQCALQQHRMIEIDVYPTAHDDNNTPPYTNRNHLGRIISGGNYTPRLRGLGSYGPTLTPLFWVSREARTAALSFYHIHLPLGTGQVLYLSSEYDIVQVRPRRPKPAHWRPESEPRAHYGFILVDFLHDARAYDYKDHGITHLALGIEIRRYLLNSFEKGVNLTPNRLHPAAAASFAAILRDKLHALFCIVDFLYSARGMGHPSFGRWRPHFAQNFPLRRRGHVTGGFYWLPADPRPDVAPDLRQVPLWEDPQNILLNWRELERLFFLFGSGVPTEDQQQAGAVSRDNHDDGGYRGCRVYICPTKHWPKTGHLPMDIAGRWSAEERVTESEAVWSRDELGQHFQYEAENWETQRADISFWFKGHPPNPKYCADSPEEMELFLEMEKLPCTAIGMWLIEAEAFPPPTHPQYHAFDLSALRPGLLLFRV